MESGRGMDRRGFMGAAIGAAGMAAVGPLAPGVALAHGINANVVHKWRRQAAGELQAAPRPSFVALPLPASATAPDIRIELQHGATRMAVTWPAAAAAECAAWMRELLK